MPTLPAAFWSMRKLSPPDPSNVTRPAAIREDLPSLPAPAKLITLVPSSEAAEKPPGSPADCARALPLLRGWTSRLPVLTRNTSLEETT